MPFSQLELICRAMVWNYDGTSDSRLYMGLDDQLYRYNVANDYYEFCDSLNKLEDSSGTSIQNLLDADDDIDDYVIKRLWNIDDGYIYGAGWKETRTDSQTVVLFKWAISNNLEDSIKLITVLQNVFIGDRSYLQWKISRLDRSTDGDFLYPYISTNEYSYTASYLTNKKIFRLFIPFGQVLTFDNFEVLDRSYENDFPTENFTDVDRYMQKMSDSLSFIDWNIDSISTSLEITSDTKLTSDSGFYQVAPNIDQDVVGANSIDRNPNLGLSFGQTGFFEIKESGGDVYAYFYKRFKEMTSDVYSMSITNENTGERKGYPCNIVNVQSSASSESIFDVKKYKDTYDHTSGYLYIENSSGEVIGKKLYYRKYNYADAKHPMGFTIIKDIEEITLGNGSPGYRLTVSRLRQLLTESESVNTSAMTWSVGDHVILPAPQYDYDFTKCDLTISSSDSPSNTNLSDTSTILSNGETLDYIKAKKFQPTCSCQDNSNNIYIAGNVWESSIKTYSSFNSDAVAMHSGSYVFKLNESAADNTSLDDIYYANLKQEGGTQFYSSGGYYTYLDMLYTDNDRILFTFINNAYRKYKEIDRYGLGVLSNLSSPPADIEIIKTFVSQPIGLAETDSSYYVAVNGGYVYKYNTDTDSIDLLGNGSQFVDNESCLASNMVAISSGEINSVDTDAKRLDDLVMGMSSPVVSLESQESIPLGKYYLWKLDNYLSDRVELADFSDMNIWEAISQLLKLAYNYVGGFSSDESSSFFLKNKDFENSDIVLEISSDVQDDNLISLEKSRGLDQIYNYISMVPNKSKIGEASFELVKQARAEEDDTFINTDDVYLNIRSKYPLNHVFICERGGDVSVDFSDIENASLFKWQIQAEPIEVRLVRGASQGDSVIVVNSTFRGLEPPRDGNGAINYSDEGVNIGDYIKVINTDNQNESYIKIEEITKDNFEYWRILHLADTLPFDLDDGNLLEVTSSFGLDSTMETYDSKWSTDGVGAVQGTSGNTFYIDNKEHISEGTVVSANDRGQFRIGNVGSWSASDGGWSVDVVSSGTTLDFAANDTVNAYYSPSKDSDGEYDFFEIGQSKNKIKISPSNDTNTMFKSGDQIRIDSKGLVMEDDKASRQVSKNVTSISKYDKNELTDIGSSFITLGHAYHYARKIIDDFSYPKYKLTIVTEYSPDIDFVNSNGLVTIKVHNHPLFKPYNSIQCYIEEIKHSIKGGNTTLTLRSVNPY